MSQKETSTPEELNTKKQAEKPKTQAKPKSSEEKIENTTEEQSLSLEEKLKAEIKALQDKNLRLFAEFENHRKRTAKERLELIGSASERVVMKLLPIADDFERALSQNENIDEGISLIYNKVVEVLKSQGVAKMEIPKGADFDAEKHDAITQIEAGEEFQSKVFEVVENGYTMGEKIIRFAKVVVGK